MQPWITSRFVLLQLEIIMKTALVLASALILSSSLAFAAPSKIEDTAAAKASPVQIQLQAEKSDGKAKQCPNGSLEVAGKCHEKAEPCLSNSECCSNNCDGGACN
jgi:hypothetical protein